VGVRELAMEPVEFPAAPLLRGLRLREHPGADAGNEADGPVCPWCDSQNVERIGAFGPQLMSYQYMCRDCRSPFEYIRRRRAEG